MNKEYSVLLLPGWQNSDADHWQSRWEQAHGYQRVQQHNWQQPLRGDWTVQLNEAVLAAPAPVVLVAHSLGCILTAWWGGQRAGCPVGGTGRCLASRAAPARAWLGTHSPPAFAVCGGGGRQPK